MQAPVGNPNDMCYSRVGVYVGEGELFTFANSGAPVLIHRDGTFDFESGVRLMRMWQCAQTVQCQADFERTVPLQEYAWRLETENTQLRKIIDLQKRTLSQAAQRTTAIEERLKEEIAQLQGEVDFLQAETLIATKTSTRGFCSASDIFYSGEGKGFALAKTL